ncbi:hypothetical protein BJ878DRAFT_534303 [Calycina marina]|uniref:Uncharacterized protein n=1 Tax=Calycina marina TaxID=1763456 RepID=A0A9P7Z3S0_9HELO|nr:hypothetical protein BJ878DRAFT_534303 [Calycina marina]
MHSHVYINASRYLITSASKCAINACTSSVNPREKIRQKRNIQTAPRKYRRDLATLEIYGAIDRNGTALYAIATPKTTIFSAKPSVILNAVVVDCPYYDVTQNQVGVPLPRSAIVDIWDCNVTGMYGGYTSIFLRNIQLIDSDGVVFFEAIFPRHYNGRATHTDILSHAKVFTQANTTITGGVVNHIEQLFPETLHSAIEAVAPYDTNTQAVTSNVDDMYSIAQAESHYDQVPEFLYLGENVEGLLAWIQISVNMTTDYNRWSNYNVTVESTVDSPVVRSTQVGGGGNSGNAVALGSGIVPPA